VSTDDEVLNSARVEQLDKRAQSALSASSKVVKICATFSTGRWHHAPS